VANKLDFEAPFINFAISPRIKKYGGSAVTIVLMPWFPEPL
jgi:hypothetical protein